MEIEWVAMHVIPESLPLHVQRPIQTIQDERGQLDPEGILRPLLEKPDTLIYAEGEHDWRSQSADRCHLAPAASLVFWSAPPGRAELRDILDQVAPRQVTWFGVATSSDQAQPFLTRLTGLVRFALKERAGRITLPELAAATAQREGTVRLGLAWLEARGHIRLQPDGEAGFQVSAGGSPDMAASARIESDLAYMLQETAAFRAFCQQADLRLLLE